jgi:hypothetical protein
VVDLNARDSTGAFSMSTLLRKGAPGNQGYHFSIIEDYVAHGVNPANGTPFQTSEGEATPEIKKLAAEYGEIDYLILKNSWGGAERTDIPTYVHDSAPGFSRLNSDYIFGYMGITILAGTLKHTIRTFVLPDGY